MKNKLEIILIISITVLFWAWAFMGIKIALEELNPIDLTLLRFLVADMVFIPYLTIKGVSIKLRDIPKVLILGIGGVTLYHLCLNFGEVYISSGIASLIISTAPAFIFLTSVLFLKERIFKSRVLGTLSALTGVIIVILGSGVSYEVENYIGALAVLIAALSATFYTVYGKVMFSRYSPAILTAYAITLGTAPLLLLLTPQKLGEFSTLSMKTWFSVLFLGLCSTVVGYLGWFYVLEKMEASRAAVFLQAIPVIAVVSGVIFLNEKITSLFALGTVMVVTGVYLVNRG